MLKLLEFCFYFFARASWDCVLRDFLLFDVRLGFRLIFGVLDFVIGSFNVDTS